MRRLMQDIETMGTHTSESLILSVGAVAFELKKDAPLISPDYFIKVLTLEPQILAQRRIERGTQKWWADQTPRAREHWTVATESNRLHPAYLSAELIKYIGANCKGDDVEIWANGIVFDIGNLEHLFHTYNSPIPWSYNSTRDMRTICRCLPKVRTMPNTLKYEGHDPVQDCLKQIWRLWEHAPDGMLEP